MIPENYTNLDQTETITKSFTDPHADFTPVVNLYDAEGNLLATKTLTNGPMEISYNVPTLTTFTVDEHKGAAPHSCTFSWIFDEELNSNLTVEFDPGNGSGYREVSGASYNYTYTDGGSFLPHLRVLNPDGDMLMFWVFNNYNEYYMDIGITFNSISVSQPFSFIASQSEQIEGDPDDEYTATYQRYEEDDISLDDLPSSLSSVSFIPIEWKVSIDSGNVSRKIGGDTYKGGGLTSTANVFLHIKSLTRGYSVKDQADGSEHSLLILSSTGTPDNIYVTEEDIPDDTVHSMEVPGFEVCGYSNSLYASGTINSYLEMYADMVVPMGETASDWSNSISVSGSAQYHIPKFVYYPYSHGITKLDSWLWN